MSWGESTACFVAQSMLVYAVGLGILEAKFSDWNEEETQQLRADVKRDIERDALAANKKRRERARVVHAATHWGDQEVLADLLLAVSWPSDGRNSVSEFHSYDGWLADEPAVGYQEPQNVVYGPVHCIDQIVVGDYTTAQVAGMRADLDRTYGTAVDVNPIGAFSVADVDDFLGLRDRHYLLFCMSYPGVEGELVATAYTTDKELLDEPRDRTVAYAGFATPLAK